MSYHQSNRVFHETLEKRFKRYTSCMQGADQVIRFLRATGDS